MAMEDRCDVTLYFLNLRTSSKTSYKIPKFYAHTFWLATHRPDWCPRGLRDPHVVQFSVDMLDSVSSQGPVTSHGLTEQSYSHKSSITSHTAARN